MSFGVDAETLTDMTGVDDIVGWDSLAHATLILRLQRVFKVRFDPEQANAAQDLGRLIMLIKETLSQND